MSGQPIDKVLHELPAPVLTKCRRCKQEVETILLDKQGTCLSCVRSDVDKMIAKGRAGKSQWDGNEAELLNVKTDEELAKRREAQEHIKTVVSVLKPTRKNPLDELTEKVKASLIQSEGQVDVPGVPVTLEIDRSLSPADALEVYEARKLLAAGPSHTPDPVSPLSRVSTLSASLRAVREQVKALLHQATRLQEVEKRLLEELRSSLREAGIEP